MLKILITLVMLHVLHMELEHTVVILYYITYLYYYYITGKVGISEQKCLVKNCCWDPEEVKGLIKPYKYLLYIRINRGVIMGQCHLKITLLEVLMLVLMESK